MVSYIKSRHNFITSQVVNEKITAENTLSKLRSMSCSNLLCKARYAGFYFLLVYIANISQVLALQIMFDWTKIDTLNRTQK